MIIVPLVHFELLEGKSLGNGFDLLAIPLRILLVLTHQDRLFLDSDALATLLLHGLFGREEGVEEIEI